MREEQSGRETGRGEERGTGWRGVWSKLRGETEEARRMQAETDDPSAAHRERALEELEAAALMDEEQVERARARIERDFLGKLIRLLARLNEDVAMRLLTGYFALRDPGVPLSAKAGFAAVLLYFLNPFDLIPDLTPVIGLLDDAGVLAGAWMYLAGHVTEAHRAQAAAFLAGEAAATV